MSHDVDDTVAHTSPARSLIDDRDINDFLLPPVNEVELGSLAEV